MLTRLLPEQVSKFWDVIKYAIEESLPPIAGEHPDKMNRILSSALSGNLTVWVSYIIDGEVKRLEAVLCTRILYDDVSNTRNLLIYCFYGYENIDSQSYVDGIRALAKYAVAKHCSQVIAYTDIEYVKQVVNYLGGESKYTFLSFDVPKIIHKINELEKK